MLQKYLFVFITTFSCIAFQGGCQHLEVAHVAPIIVRKTPAGRGAGHGQEQGQYSLFFWMRLHFVLNAEGQNPDKAYIVRQ